MAVGKKNRLQSHRNSTLDISRLEVVKVFIKEKHKEEKRKGQGQIYMGGQVDTGSQMRMLARDGAKERRKAQGAQCHGTRARRGNQGGSADSVRSSESANDNWTTRSGGRWTPLNP